MNTANYKGHSIEIVHEPKDENDIFGFGIPDQWVIKIDGQHVDVGSSEVSAEDAMANAKKIVDRWVANNA